jgi:hypothetical protein
MRTAHPLLEALLLNGVRRSHRVGHSTSSCGSPHSDAATWVHEKGSERRWERRGLCAATQCTHDCVKQPKRMSYCACTGCSGQGTRVSSFALTPLSSAQHSTEAWRQGGLDAVRGTDSQTPVAHGQPFLCVFHSSSCCGSVLPLLLCSAVCGSDWLRRSSLLFSSLRRAGLPASRSRGREKKGRKGEGSDRGHTADKEHGTRLCPPCVRTRSCPVPPSDCPPLPCRACLCGSDWACLPPLPLC